jgi:hypothetical protein
MRHNWFLDTGFLSCKPDTPIQWLHWVLKIPSDFPHTQPCLPTKVNSASSFPTCFFLLPYCMGQSLNVLMGRCGGIRAMVYLEGISVFYHYCVRFRFSINSLYQFAEYFFIRNKCCILSSATSTAIEMTMWFFFWMWIILITHLQISLAFLRITLLGHDVLLLSCTVGFDFMKCFQCYKFCICIWWS